jgi:antitoxin component HigA of HigAB toxin-antitoxin module
MPATKRRSPRAVGTSIPSTFHALIRLLPPKAIIDDSHLARTTAVIDRLMAAGRLTRDQRVYLETLVQLVQVYEAAHHAIDAPKGLPALRHLLDEHAMNASDLARVLGVHPSMGSKILSGERSLTVSHLKALSLRFGVQPTLFMD